jgi:hypothetical protein
MLHGKIGRAIHRKLYVFFKSEFIFRNTDFAIYRKLDCHAQFSQYQRRCTQSTRITIRAFWVSLRRATRSLLFSTPLPPRSSLLMGREYGQPD